MTLIYETQIIVIVYVYHPHHLELRGIITFFQTDHTILFAEMCVPTRGFCYYCKDSYKHIVI